MMLVGDAQKLLSFLPATKVKSFAALAKTLDIAEFNDFRLPKRRTLLLCLLYQAQVKTRDHMVEMFLKRIKKIHNNAKTKLEDLREKYLNQTQTMLEMFGEILIFSDQSLSYTQLGKQVQGLLDSNGGTPLLLEQYSEIASVNTKDHFPLLWSFYSPYRKALFDLVKSLEICSTSNEQSVIEAVRFVLDHQQRRSKFLKANLDLSFISDQWLKLVVVEVDGEELLVRRLSLPQCWGSGKKAAADGSKFEIYENNLMSEYHIRYGSYGGIAYHHVSDPYIALFTHFIACGVWEAVYILDGLLKNTSDIQPDTLHADTQGAEGTAAC